MKIRTDFVTNSSSYSSCVIRIDNPILHDILKKYREQHDLGEQESDSSTKVCSNGLAVYRKNIENSGISYAPDSLTAVLDALKELLNNTWVDNKEATGLYDEIAEHKEEILKSFREVTWYVSLDFNNEDPSASAHGVRLFKWPKREQDLREKVTDQPDPDVFKYEIIDQYNSSFYRDLIVNSAPYTIKSKNNKVEADGKDITVCFKVEKILAEINSYFSGILSGNDQNLFLYDPIENDANSISLGVTPELPISVVRHRILMFEKIIALSMTERASELIVSAAKKKKDKTLFINRTLPIATLLVVDQKLESFILYAKNTKANTIEVFGRRAFAFDRDRTQDLIVLTNIFKEE